MKGRFKNSKAILATDKVPDSIFGYPVVSKDTDYTEADIGFFRDHPEAGGYYDLEDSEEPDAQSAEKAGRSYDPGEPGDEPTGYSREPVQMVDLKTGKEYTETRFRKNDFYHSVISENEYNRLWQLNTRRRKDPLSSTYFQKQADGTYRHELLGPDYVVYPEDFEDILAAEEGRPSRNRFRGRPGSSPAHLKRLKDDPGSYIHFRRDGNSNGYVNPTTGAKLSRRDYLNLYLKWEPNEPGEKGDEPTWKDGGGYTHPYRARHRSRWNPETKEYEDTFVYYGAGGSRPLTSEEYNAQWRLNTMRRTDPFSSASYVKLSDGTYRHPRLEGLVIYPEDMEDLVAAEEGRPSYNRFLGVARPDLYKRDALGSYRHIDGRGPTLTDKEYEKLVARHKARENDPLSYIHFVHDFKTGNYVLPETGARMSRDEYEKYVLSQTFSELQDDPDSFVHVDPNPRLDGSYVNRKTGEKLSLGTFQYLRSTEMARYGIPEDMVDPIVMNDFSRRLKTSIATFGLSEPEGREIWGNTLMAASVLPSGGSSMTAGAFLRGLATKQFAKRVATDAGLSAGFQLLTREGRANLVNDPLRFLGDTAVDTMKFATIRNGAMRGSLQAGAVDYVKSRLEGESSYDATMNGMKTAALFAAIGGYGKLSSLPSSRLARYSMHAPVVGTMGYGIGRANGLFGGESTSYDGLTGTGPAPVVIPSYGSYNVNNNRVERVTLGR